MKLLIKRMQISGQVLASYCYIASKKHDLSLHDITRNRLWLSKTQVEWESFDAMKVRIRDEWQRQPPTAEVISQELQDKTARTIEQLNQHS